MNSRERSKLLDDLLDGNISDADRIRIEAELLVDPDLRQEYYRLIQLEQLLRLEAIPSDEDESAIRKAIFSAGPQVSMQDRKTPSGLLAGLVIGLSLSLLVGGWVWWWNQAPDPEQILIGRNNRAPIAYGYGVIKGQSSARWKSEAGELDLHDGDLLPEGIIQLVSGQVHIELFSGVELLLDGRTQFSVDSSMQISLHDGRLRAVVPSPAIGFRVRTKTGDVVDLGTEFAIQVGESGTDVNVLDGEVELHTNQNGRRKVVQGEAMRLNEDGEITQSEGMIELISPEEFRHRHEVSRKKRLAQWTAEIEQVRSDPRLVAHYQFDKLEEGNRTVINLSSHASSSKSNGTVVAAKRAFDRWGRVGNALDFSRVGSQVRVNLPQEFQGITLNCWVRINSLDRWYNSLFLTDGHDDFEPHWQIMEDGRIFFSVKLPKGEDASQSKRQHEYYSPEIWHPSLSGRWIMLSVTYDIQSKRVTHFVNGKPVGSEAIPQEDLVETIRIGAASICNWNDPVYRKDAEFILRNLNGSMDEFSIYNGALSDEEIKRLFQTGNPDDQ